MTDAPDIQPVLARVRSGETLTRDETNRVFESLLGGSLDEAQIGALLMGLAGRGPSVAELAGAATAMRAHVTPVAAPDEPGVRVIDTCGTGGAPKTFNVSTAAAIVAAACAPDPATGVARVVVAKHGNRSRTGRGSAEVLAALGVNVDASPETQSACLNDAGVCFCFAIHHHPAMRYAAGPRRSLGFPTIFNLLGPLTNPAGASRQLIGVYAEPLVDLVAGALVELGAERAMVMHSQDGLDELTVTAPTLVAHVENGSVRRETIDPASLGLAAATIEQVRVESVEASAELIRRILGGESGPASDMVALTAAGALLVGGAANSWSDAIVRARDAISSGRAQETLANLCERSHQSS
ncbi:MAG: anthranilate phosphoribosyltransferase [Phycisphaerales bacterium]